MRADRWPIDPVIGGDHADRSAGGPLAFRRTKRPAPVVSRRSACPMNDSPIRERSNLTKCATCRRRSLSSCQLSSVNGRKLLLLFLLLRRGGRELGQVVHRLEAHVAAHHLQRAIQRSISAMRHCTDPFTNEIEIEAHTTHITHTRCPHRSGTDRTAELAGSARGPTRCVVRRCKLCIFRNCCVLDLVAEARDRRLGEGALVQRPALALAGLERDHRRLRADLEA